MKKKPKRERLHAPDPSYFGALPDSLLPPGMLANTACTKESTAVAEDPDKVTCSDCRTYMQRKPQFYNFLKARWSKKTAGKYLVRTHGES